MRFLFIALVFLAVACNQSPQKPEVITTTPADMEPEAGINIDISKLATTTDLICGMSVKNEVADTLTYNGKLYGFCSKECKEEFAKNPAEYLK